MTIKLGTYLEEEFRQRIMDDNIRMLDGQLNFHILRITDRSLYDPLSAVTHDQMYLSLNAKISEYEY